MARLLSKLFFALAVAGLAFSSQNGFTTSNVASAALLSLTQTFPDVTLGDLDVTYDSASGAFDVHGIPTKFEIDGLGGIPEFTLAHFEDPLADIQLILDPAGTPLSGSLSITGKIPSLLSIANSGTLLTGDILDFGFRETGPFILAVRFEMLFRVTGGDLAGAYFGQTAGLILGATTLAMTYNGTFTSDFSFDSGLSSADAFVPEPSAVAMWAVGMVVLSRKQRFSPRNRRAWRD